MTESDKLLREACILAEEMYWDDFFKRFASFPLVEIPEGQHERILKLIYEHSVDNKEKTNLDTRGITSKRIKAVIIAAAIIVLLAITAFAIEPVRNFIINVYSDCTEIVFNSNNNNDYLYAEYTFIPEGYVLVDSIQGKNSHSLIYSNEEKQIVINSMSNKNSKTVIDTEKAETGEIVVNNNIGYYSKVENIIILTWCSGRYNHIITADISEEIFSVEELVKIAQSRKPIR